MSSCPPGSWTLCLLLALGCDGPTKPAAPELPSSAPPVVAAEGDRWEFAISSDGGDPPAGIVALPDGGWALAGSRPPPLSLGGETFRGRPHLVYAGVFDAAGKHRFSMEVAQSGGQTFGELAVAPDGDLILAAEIYGSSVSVLGKQVEGEGPLVARFSPKGVLRWAQMESGARPDPNPRRSRNTRVTVTASGQVYVAYHVGPKNQQTLKEMRAGVVLSRLGPGGKPEWTREILDRGFWTDTLVCPHPGGGVVIAGSSDGSLRWKPALAKAAPAPSSPAAVQAKARAEAMEEARAFGLIHTGGYGGGKPRFFAARFDADGRLLWQQSQWALKLKFGKVYDLAMGLDGSAWFVVGGRGELTLGGQTMKTDDWDLLVLRVDPEGEWMAPIHLQRPGAQGRGRLLRREENLLLFADSAGKGKKRRRIGFRLGSDGKAIELRLSGDPLLAVASQGARFLGVTSPGRGSSKAKTQALVVERLPWPTALPKPADSP